MSDNFNKNFKQINTLSCVEIKLLHKNFENGVWNLPDYATNGSVAFDLLAAINSPITIPSFKTEFIPSGLSVWVNDPNFVLIIAPRSGSGCKKGIVLGNNIGLIDPDYQGPLIMCVYNRLLNEDIVISPGDYIAQAILIPKFNIHYKVVNEFSNSTERGEKGFGHSR